MWVAFLTFSFIRVTLEAMMVVHGELLVLCPLLLLLLHVRPHVKHPDENNHRCTLPFSSLFSLLLV